MGTSVHLPSNRNSKFHYWLEAGLIILPPKQSKNTVWVLILIIIEMQTDFFVFPLSSSFSFVLPLPSPHPSFSSLLLLLSCPLRWHLETNTDILYKSVNISCRHITVTKVTLWDVLSAPHVESGGTLLISHETLCPSLYRVTCCS